MKKPTTAALMALLLALVQPTWASDATGKIHYVIIRDSDGLIYLEVTGPRSAKPDCAQNHNYFMIKDENSATGKRLYAMLLAAQLTGKTVTVSGTGACTRWPDGEDIGVVRLMD
jgi:hypothetical protein